jgi:hypothetical protein
LKTKININHKFGFIFHPTIQAEVQGKKEDVEGKKNFFGFGMFLVA